MTLPNHIQITPELIASHGLKPDEYQRILDLIGREPSFTELGIFSAMWNEHCSYKSSKKWLKTLPTTGPRVIQGPGENAGVVDIDDGDVVVFKMESHNHPSYIEPYQGAATGVGGILRDVFTMGARPIAAMNALRFGAPDHPKTRHLVAGVVAGVGGYGNSFGVPTVGGEVEFDARYNGNMNADAFMKAIWCASFWPTRFPPIVAAYGISRRRKRWTRTVFAAIWVGLSKPIRKSRAVSASSTKMNRSAALARFWSSDIRRASGDQGTGDCYAEERRSRSAG